MPKKNKKAASQAIADPAAEPAAEVDQATAAEQQAEKVR